MLNSIINHLYLLEQSTDTMKKLPMNEMLQIMFTEDEWDAIYNAMADYQDHGEEETELAYSVQSKITALFN